MSDFDRTVKMFKDAINRKGKQTAPLDIMGKVTRVEDGVAWVRFAGSEVGDTPVRMNIDCKVGDVVQVRSSDGKAWIVGNQSAPPTDDSKAEEVEKKTEKFAERIKSVEKVAGDAEEVANAVNQKVWEDEAGLHIADGKQDAAAERNSIWNSLGMLFRKGLNPILGILTGDSPRVAIYDGQGSGESHEVASFGASARIGAQDGYQTVITEGSSSIVSPENVELFSIRPSGNPSSETVWFREYPEGENVTSITLTHTPIPESKIDVYFRKSGGGQMLRIFTAGHSGTAAVYNSEISYDGENTITINNAEGDTYRIEYVMYNYLSPSIDLGALTIGTRKAETNIGNGSATIGRELTAEYPYQVVVGVGNRNFEDSLFEVGNGNVTTQKTVFRVKNNGSICEGSGYTTASGDYSHAEGYSTSASGNYSHSEGYYTEATGFYSHAEGFYTDATNNYSHAEGYYTESSNYASHAEGYYTKASGLYSHSEGYYTIAASNHSHAEGSHTIASSDYQHVEGKYNIKDANSKYAHIIGNGTSDDDRSNALTVDWDGNVKAKGNFYANCASDSSGTAHIGQVFNWQGNLKSNLTANAGAYVEGNGSITLKGGHTYLVLAYVAMTNSTNGSVERRAQIFNKTANSGVLTGNKFVASQVWGTVETQTIYEAGEDVTLTVRGAASRPTTTIPTAWIRAVCIA